jgi:hypothetical protein
VLLHDAVLAWLLMQCVRRCHPLHNALVLRRCTLITQSEIMDYISYW